jgi:inorganic triphosphatase YgiF
MGEAPGNPARSVEEREVKLTVVDDFVLPSLSDVDGVTVVDHGDERLRAVYWDTDVLGLAHAGVGLRHRNGTWCFKGGSRREGDAVVREELEVVAQGDAIPPALCSRIEEWVDPSAVRPVAHLDALRRRIDVTDGRSRAEVVHDRVNVVDGARVIAHFAEVEVEFSEQDHALADRLVRLMVENGAVVDTTPKYVRALRALGHQPPTISS